MSRLLKPGLLVHMVVSAVLGLLLLIVPGRFLSWLGWVPIDPIVSRLLGAALLGMWWGDLRVWRGVARAETRWWVEVQLGFAALAGAGVLRHLLVGHWPAMVWILFGVLVLFALTWLGVLVGEWRQSRRAG